jgi:hypothetical protein
MPRHTEQVIRTTVSTDLNGLPYEWEMELDHPADDDPWAYGFQAWGRNRSFIPRSITVTRRPATDSASRPPTIAIAVSSKVRGESAPLWLQLPWTYAAELARIVVKAARSLDHAALDGIAELLDGKEWSADELDAIATLVRHTGREVRDAAGTGGSESNGPHTVC